MTEERGKRFIRFQWKLASLTAAAVLLTLAVVGITSYNQTRALLTQGEKERLRAIASSAAVAVPADTIAGMALQGGDTSQAYRYAQETLREFWEATGGDHDDRNEGITVARVVAGGGVLALVRSADPVASAARSWRPPQAILDSLATEPSGFTAAVDSAGKHLLFAAVPIRARGQTAPVGYAFASIRTDRLLGALLADVWSLALLAALIFFVLAFLSIWFSRKLTAGIDAVSVHTAAIARGNLRDELTFRANDEIGELADSVRTMSVSLRTLLRDVEAGASEVAATAEELAASAEEMSASTEEVAGAAQSISSSADRQTQGINIVVAAATHSAERSLQTATHARSAQVIAESVGQSAKQGSVSAQQALESMSKISSVTRDAVPAVGELGEKSARIEKLTETIAAIARQTNLLSLNAAIEAARAGEHGRGFAVVADEIRKLAADTGKALESIRLLTSEIRAASERTGERIGQVSESVSRGEAVIRESSESLAQIAVEIDRSREAVLRIVEAAEAQQKEADSLAREIEKVATVASDNAVTSQQVSAVVEEQTSSMNHITASSQDLAEIAARLKSSMTRFEL